MSDEIILYACPSSELQPETEELSYSESSDGDDIILYAEPQHGTCPATEITLYAEPTGENCPCAPPDALPTEIDVYWPSESEEVPNTDTPEPSDTKTLTTFGTYPALRFDVPELCHWVGTVLDAITDHRTTVITAHPGDGGHAPDPVHCTPGASFGSERSDNQIVPGAILEMTHYLDCPHPGNIITATERGKWNTVAITGGIITAVNGDIDDNDHSYQVQIYGVDVQCWPSDWVEWEVGDWVFVIASVEEDTDSVTLNNKGNLEPAILINPRIVPLQIGKHGAGVGYTPFDLANKSYNPMSLRTIPAKVLTINDDNTVDVETAKWPLVESVPLKWHCPETTDYEWAIQAYEVDDMVNFVIPAVAWDAHVPGPDDPPPGAVMGWIDRELRRCNPYLYYMGGDSVVCLDDDGIVQENCNADESYKFYRIFDVKQKLTDTVEISSTRNSGLAINRMCAVWPVAEGKSGHGQYMCDSSSSIMLDKWTAHAIEWHVLQPGGSVEYYWAVCVDYNGEHWQFPEPLYINDDMFDVWPKPKNPFSNLFACGPTELYGYYNPVHGFDLWELDVEITEKPDWEYGDIMLTICGDNSQLHIWNLTKEEWIFRSLGISSQIAASFPDDEYYIFHIILLGVKKLNVFFAQAELFEGKIASFGEIFTCDTTEDTITAHGESGHEIAYNPFLGEIWHVNHGSIRVVSVVEAPKIYLYNIHDPNLPDSCRLHTIYAGLGGGSGPGFSTGYYRKSNEGGGASNTDWWMTEREVGPILNNFGKGYIGYFDGEKVSGTISHRTLQTAITDAMGCSDYDHWGFRLTGGPGIGYTNWAETVGDLLGISVTKDGTGSKRLVTFLNGLNRASGEIIESEEILNFGSLDENYIDGSWPYIRPYAWVKHAYDSDGVEYENIVIQKNNDGDTAYGDDEDLFFAVNANYAPENV